MKTAVRDYVWNILLHIFFILFSFLIIYPFWTVLVDSFDDSIRVGLKILPGKFSLEAYKTVFGQNRITVAFVNSLFRTAAGSVLAVLVTFGAAYALSKKQMPFNRFMTVYVIIPMFFGGGIIPFYILMNRLGLMDSRWALILPMVFSGFNILIMRNFIYSIPTELEESALLDGANEMSIALRIFLPLSLPIIATVALWCAVDHWNSWFDAMIYIRSQSKQVLQVILRRVLMESQISELYDDSTRAVRQTEKSVRAALLFVTTLPILVVYPFAQKYFIKGLTTGAVKG
jgi:putative aldouronate transport system permease protein